MYRTEEVDALKEKIAKLEKQVDEHNKQPPPLFRSVSSVVRKHFLAHLIEILDVLYFFAGLASVVLFLMLVIKFGFWLF